MPGNPFRDATAADMLARVAARFPARQALIAADRRVTYADFLREAERYARGLLALGVGRDDKVALWLPARPGWFFAFHACAMIGAVAVFLNPRYKAHELSYILAQSDATTLLLADHLGPTDYLEILGDVLPGLAHAEPGALEIEGFPRLRRVVVDADDPYAGCLRLADVLDAGADPALDEALARARARVGPDDPMAVLGGDGREGGRAENGRSVCTGGRWRGGRKG